MALSIWRARSCMMRRCAIGCRASWIIGCSRPRPSGPLEPAPERASSLTVNYLKKLNFQRFGNFVERSSYPRLTRVKFAGAASRDRVLRTRRKSWNGECLKASPFFPIFSVGSFRHRSRRHTSRARRLPRTRPTHRFVRGRWPSRSPR